MSTPSAAPPDDNFIAKLMRGEVPAHSVATTLGARIVEADALGGRLEMSFVGSPAFCNPAGHVQGGMLAAMLDDVTASLVTLTVRGDERCATLDLHTSFLRPARVGPIVARARLVRRGREICSVVGELSQDDRLVATATATCMITKLARPAPG